MRRAALTALLGAGALLALGLAAAAAEKPAALRSRYVCRGEEPFWSLTLDERGGVLSRLAASGTESQDLAGRLTRFTHLDPNWAMWRGHTVAGAYSLVATLRAESCASTMADTPPAPYRTLVSFPDGSVAAGCCQLEQSLDLRQAPRPRYDAKPPTDWSKTLPELLPAIRACLSAAGAAADRVSHAAAGADGLVAVRLLAADGGVTDCRVDLAAAQPPQLTAAAAGAAAPAGDGAPLLLVVRGEPPTLRCGRAETVLDARGVLLGYLYYADGCP